MSRNQVLIYDVKLAGIIQVAGVSSIDYEDP